MCRRVAEIPISKAPDGLVGADSVDYGDQEDFLHLQDTFPRYSIIPLIGNKKRKIQRLRRRMV